MKTSRISLIHDACDRLDFENPNGLLTDLEWQVAVHRTGYYGKPRSRIVTAILLRISPRAVKRIELAIIAKAGTPQMRR